MKIRSSRDKGNRFVLASMAAATVGLSTLAASFTAQAQEGGEAPVSVSRVTLEEVHVTARRESENLQDVPVSVQVVSGKTIQDLLFTKPSDMSNLAAGLDISLATPSDATVTLRGVRWTPGSGSPATPIYLNEISFDTAQLLQTMYDIGQVEVLRGPQGTARGAPSISGAVTITSRRPDLQEMGGYVQGILGDHDRINGQGAISFPLIEDKLAIRLAGSYDQTPGNRVESLYNSKDSEIKNKSLRASVRYAPVEDVMLDVMYQRLEQSGQYLNPVAGTGSPGLAPISSPNFNGPPIQAKQYLSVEDLPNRVKDTVEYYTVNASWDILDQFRLSYNFGDQHTTGGSATNLDRTNMVPGFDALPQQGTEDPEYRVHELRFSSIREPGKFWDFDIGYYHQKFDGVSAFDIPVFLSGAFGNPATAGPGDVTTPNPRYILDIEGDFVISRTLESFYANVQFYLTDETELTVGLRSIDDKSSTPATLARGSSWNAYVNPLEGVFSCAGLADLSPAAAGTIDSPIYPGLCDTPVPAVVETEGAGDENDDVIYNVSLSHRFTDDVLAYVTTGTSYRGGLPSLNNPGLPAELSLPDSETATSYEIGVKSTLNDWLQINADIFLIDYQDQLSQFQGIPYYNSVTDREGSTSVAFYRNVDAQVMGGELEITAAPVENLTLTTYVSYSQIEAEGGNIPCIDPDRPIGADNVINSCPIEKGENLNATPKLQASLLSNYIVPLGAFDGYLRALVSYQDKNPNFGASIEDTPSYTTVDLFAGLSSDADGWDVGLYARNLFDKKVQLTRLPGSNSFYPVFGEPGYDHITLNARREVGLTFQYAFGGQR